jgi:hypothetical protein
MDQPQSSSHPCCAHQEQTVCDAIVRLAQQLRRWANTLDQRSWSAKPHTRWKARGSQTTLRQVANHLFGMTRHSASSPLALRRALQDERDCLETNLEDARQEAAMAHHGRGWPIAAWKAEGEARVLPRVITLLSHCIEERAVVRSTIPPAPPLLPLAPFPPLPADLSPEQQELLAGLEASLSQYARTLVKVDMGQHDALELLFLSLDRLLASTSIRRVLLLVGSASLKPVVQRASAAWISLEDGRPLSKRYVCEPRLTLPLASTTRVCLASMREIQLVTRGTAEEHLPAGTFDAVIVFGMPAPLSPLWPQILTSLAAPYRLSFGEVLDEAWVDLFDHQVVVGHTGGEALDEERAG